MPDRLNIAWIKNRTKPDTLIVNSTIVISTMNDSSPSNNTAARKAVADLVTRWIRPEVRQISAYHVPVPGDMVKLDAMENPYGWPESLNNTWLEQLQNAAINRYPDPAARELKATLKKAFTIPVDHEVLLGNGSDELIQMLAMAVAGPDRVVMSPEPSFVMYQMIALMVGMKYIGVPLQQDFSLDLDAMLTAIERHNPALIFLAYPNNPTGNLFDKEAIEAILQTSQGLVIVDEAYYAFANSSLLTWLDQYNNLMIMRTVSKMGMAGLRLGYLVGDRQWLEQIDKMRLPYNINVLTQMTVQIALQHIDSFDQQTQAICKDRETLLQALHQVDGIDVFPSYANFVLFRVQRGSSQEVFDRLKEHGVLIKNLGNQPGALHNCLRVTVGTRKENDKFLQALQQIVH